MSANSVSNQTEGTNVKKVDDNPSQGTISLQEAQEQPTACQEDNLNVANKVQREANNSCQSPTEQAPKHTRKLPVSSSFDFFMENLTEESEPTRVINCNGIKHIKNQNQVRKLDIPKFSQKDFVFFTKTLEVSTLVNLMNYSSPYLQILHTLHALQNII